MNKELTPYDHVRIAIEHAAIALQQIRARKLNAENVQINIQCILDELQNADSKWDRK